MNNSISTSQEGLRLFDLLIRFQQGDQSCFENIIRQYSRMIGKASYNSYIGGPDDDLRSEILLAIFLKLQKFTIPDREVLIAKMNNHAGDSFTLQSVQA